LVATPSTQPQVQRDVVVVVKPDASQATAQGQQAETQRKANLANCLSTDNNCVDGTSNNCAPSVPYGDRFGGRRQISATVDAARACGVGIMGWFQQCWIPKVEAILALADVKELVSKVDDVRTRVLNLPSDVATGMPTCQFDAETVSQVPFWCRNQQSDCVRQATAAFDALDCARRVDQFLYTAEAQANRNTLKKQHDDACQQQYGN
jgi:hypothetical protein